MVLIMSEGINESWTTYLGRSLNEMQSNQAPEGHVLRVEGALIEAIQNVRHIRRCYNRSNKKENQ